MSHVLEINYLILSYLIIRKFLYRKHTISETWEKSFVPAPGHAPTVNFNNSALLVLFLGINGI